MPHTRICDGVILVVWLSVRTKVPALLPDLSRYSVPETLSIQPRVVWKAVLDATSLLLAFALVQAAHALQLAGVIAPWVRLP